MSSTVVTPHGQLRVNKRARVSAENVDVQTVSKHEDTRVIANEDGWGMFLATSATEV